MIVGRCKEIKSIALIIENRSLRLAIIGWIPLLFLAIGSLLVSASQAADSLHLLGFVDRRCDQGLYCVELRVEQVYSGIAVEKVKVYYDAGSRIFDPENYALTLVQSRIIEGSHLRVLLEVVPGGYRARFIWIGD